jgi:3-oxoacyl-[acyl-carrier protein] reductase
MDLGVKDKIAMVGGASRGLGFSVARVLAAEGARVSIASRSEAAVNDAARRIAEETGADVLPVACDVARADAIERWHAETMRRFGGVDLLFTNSGGPPPGAFLNFDDAAWRQAFELLVMSVIRSIRLALPSMQARGGGSILVSTSSSVKEPIVNLTLSNVMRSSVSSLAKTLSLELAPQRIRVNQLIPGRIATDRLRELDEANAARGGISVEQQTARVIATIPMGRYGDPDEFGRAAAFLLSDAASYITGATLQVDGGLIKYVL